MSSEVPLLADETIKSEADRCYGAWIEGDLKFARAIEQAVRAQWAAEVEAKDAEIERSADFIEQMIAERDSAQAEAKAAKEALVAARKHIDFMLSIEESALGCDLHRKALSSIDATLTNPRAGETA